MNQKQKAIISWAKFIFIIAAIINLGGGARSGNFLAYANYGRFLLCSALIVMVAVVLVFVYRDKNKG